MRDIEPNEIRPGMLVRLGNTVSHYKGFIDRVVKILARDDDHIVVKFLDALITRHYELRISEWQFSQPDEEYLRVLHPDEVWAESIEI